MAEYFDTATQILPERLQRETRQIPPQTKRSITELRLRADAPLLLTAADDPLFLRTGGRCGCFDGSDVLTVTAAELQETFLRACRWSVHSFESQIRDGFLTLPNGHRLGLCGVTDAATQALTLVTSMNLRIARQAPAAAKMLCDKLFSHALCSVIVAGPPVSGKTTMLRDLARRLSEGECGRYYRVSVIDTRQEFPFLPYCDVLTGCDKAQGIRRALRVMSPQMLLCDEIGTAAEIDALEQSFSAGAQCAVSVHTDSAKTLRLRKPLQRLLQTQQFHHVVLLRNAPPCTIEAIYDARELCP
jgi:stage III sporulation protein AA